VSELFKLDGIMDGLAEYLATATDEELLEDARNDGRNPDLTADQVRAILCRAIDEWKLEQILKK
jgi:hypothetical protein